MKLVHVYTESMWGKVAAFASAAVLVVGCAGVAVHELREHQAREQACEAVNMSIRETAETRHSLAERSGTDSTLVVGDSYTAGQWLENPANGWAFELADSESGSWIIDGSGGSGFTNAGPCGGRTFVDILHQHEADRYTTIILQGGLNDLTADHEARAARGTVRLAERHADNVIVVGSFAPTGVEANQVRATNAQLRAAAEAEGATFVDPSSWDYRTLPDRLHPTAAGHAAIATKVRQLLRDSSREG